MALRDDQATHEDTETALRLAALHRLGLLHTPPDPGLDRIVRIARERLDAPVSLVSLGERNRQWFKARAGLDVEAIAREGSFCAEAMARRSTLVVLDATADPRFAHTEHVAGPPYIRSYVGAPLILGDGTVIGTLCVLSTEVRQAFTDAQMASLEDLAALAVDIIEMRASQGQTQGRADVERLFDRFLDALPIAVVMLDERLRVIACGRSWRDLMDLPDMALIGRELYDAAPNLPAAWREQHLRCLAGEPIAIDKDEMRRPNGEVRHVSRWLHPWHRGDGSIGGIICSIVPIDERIAYEDALAANRRFTETILETIEDGIIACDASGDITVINSALRRIHADPTSPRLSESLWTADGRTKLPLERSPLYRAQRGEPNRGDLQVERPDGSRRHIATQAAPMRDANGNHIGAVVCVHDITLEREERIRYQAIFNHTFQFCALLAPDGAIERVNDSALRALQASEEDTIGRKIWERWFQDRSDRAAIARAVRQARLGIVTRRELDMAVAGGRTIPVDCSLTPIWDEGGRLVHIVAEARDISDKRADETALRQRQAELHLILDNVPIRIFVKDDQSRVVRCNRAAARSLGRRVEDVEGRVLADVMAIDADADRHEDDLLFASAQPRRGHPVPDPLAPHRWIRTDKTPHTDPDSGERRMFVAMSDVTSEMEAMEALRESERQHRLLYHRTPVMLQTVNPDGHLLTVSDYWLEGLGYTRDEVIGRHYTSFMTPASRQKAVKSGWPTLVETGISKDCEYTFVRKDGTLVEALVSEVAEFDGENVLRRALAALTDVTERNRTERQLVQSQKMEAIGQLTGGMAHDFNNLLCVILGNLQMIEPRLEDDRSKRRMAAAIHAIDSGSSLTGRLLGFAKGQSLDRALVDLRRLVEGMVGLLQRGVGEAVEVKTVLSDRQLYAETDAAQFESALLNLAVNARDAMPHGGTVTITCDTVELRQADGRIQLPPGEYARIAVADNGFGMPPELLGRVLEPFVSTKAAGQGTGLGLPMVDAFVKKSGGQLVLDSEMGIGTRATLYLPLADPPEEELPTVAGRPRVVPPSAPDSTILVVDDQADLRAMVVEMAEELGYRTLDAASGQAAIEIMRTTPVDLLLSDVVMPGGTNGIALAKWANSHWPSLPVILISGNLDPNTLAGAQFADRWGFLKKPFTQSDLADLLSRALTVS